MGLLKPYTGRPLPMRINRSQQKKLDEGKSVLYNERQGKTGTGVCIADINSPPNICMDKICDLKAYPKMVPHVKKFRFMRIVGGLMVHRRLVLSSKWAYLA